MTPSFNVAILQDSVLQTLLALVHDQIPNIRFNVAKTFEGIADAFGNNPEAKPLFTDNIIPALRTLTNDSDADVRYFASRGLTHVMQITSSSSTMLGLRTLRIH